MDLKSRLDIPTMWFGYIRLDPQIILTVRSKTYVLSRKVKPNEPAIVRDRWGFEADVQIGEMEFIPIKEITDEDAIKAGLIDQRDYRHKLKHIFRYNYSLNHKVWRIPFKYVNILRRNY